MRYRTRLSPIVEVVVGLRPAMLGVAIAHACLAGTCLSAEDPTVSAPGGTIFFSSLAPRGWNLYRIGPESLEPQRLTDHPALDYNAAFSPDCQTIALVSERDGNPELYTVRHDGAGLKRLTNDFALDDHPAWSPDGKRIVFSSTRQASSTPGQAWNALYVMNADGTSIKRLSPPETPDYSPTWSPDGNWIACASVSGNPGGTDLYLMKPDGSERRLVVKDGGWPTFAADSASLFFHRKNAGKWGVWRVRLDGAELERMTPEAIEAFTPRASVDGKWLALAVLRDRRRQIERMDLASRTLHPVTNQPDVDHWNPSIAVDGQIIYHRSDPNSLVRNVESWSSPPDCPFQMLRIAGAFPAVAPDGRQIALTGGNFSRLDTMNIDGSQRRTLFETKPRNLFSLSWSPAGNRIAFAHGRSFQEADYQVDIETITPEGADRRTLTEKTGNNGFPSFDPAGQQLVFRSGRGGSKNLYIMNKDGGGVRRLTDGPWTDTMADWSPAGDWIAFASNRGGNFEIWLIKPDGSGLKKLIGGPVLNTHPHFAPNGEWIVFASQRAGLSAEEISLPSQFQAYGDLFAIRIDGSGLVRLAHNAFEEGPSAWTRFTDITPSTEGMKVSGHEY